MSLYLRVHYHGDRKTRAALFLWRLRVFFFTISQWFYTVNFYHLKDNCSCYLLLRLMHHVTQATQTEPHRFFVSPICECLSMESPESALFTIYNSVYVNSNLILHSKILHTTLIFHQNSRANSVDTPFDFVCLFFHCRALSYSKLLTTQHLHDSWRWIDFFMFLFDFFYGYFYNSQGEKTLHHNKKIHRDKKGKKKKNQY